MSDDQAARTSNEERLLYANDVVQPGSTPRGQQWYADNTREPIRDETLRQGLIRLGAVVERTGVSTTSPKPRYALADDFAALFDPALTENALGSAIETWRLAHLTPAALARVRIVKSGQAGQGDRVLVKLPSGETRQMSPGASSVISKAVIEEFARLFLKRPALVWLSESGNKVVEADALLAASIGITIDAARGLPDIILADVDGAEVLVVFIEVVATDGPVTEGRRSQLLQLAQEGGLTADRVAFVTAYLDRQESPLKKNLPELAWNSFVWLASEADRLIALHGGTSMALTDLLPKKAGPEGAG